GEFGGGVGDDRGESGIGASPGFWLATCGGSSGRFAGGKYFAGASKWPMGATRDGGACAGGGGEGPAELGRRT
ncbi:hypothetical protein N9894_05010, partial [Akkermansiaceae bacterium]|nr:hypothetical protein [Akkermansiaceae bacterium]